MAKYNIKKLNYIACGSARNFINMDTELGYELYDYVHLLCAETGSRGYADADAWKHGVSGLISVDIGLQQGEGYSYPSDFIYRDADMPLSREKTPTGIVLDEHQPKYVETGSSRDYLRLYLSCCTLDMRKKIIEFNKSRGSANQTYVLENTDNDKNNLTCGGIRLRNAYDVVDVSIKKLGRHEKPNSGITGLSEQYPHSEPYELTHHDIYAPDMEKKPIGFCQSNSTGDFDSDAVIMTEHTKAAPYSIRSDMENYRAPADDRQSYDVGLGSETVKTYLYRPYTDGEDYPESACFVPDRTYNGIARAYLLDMPTENLACQNSITSNYDSGEIYCRRLMTGKNAYDSQYSMNMPEINKLSASRTYCGIGACGGNVYLKYWDDVNYSTAVSVVDSDHVKQYGVVSSNSYDDSRYSDIKPYQKIEYLFPVDYMQSSKHKSNLFSIEILDTGIDRMEERAKAVVGNPKSSEQQAISAENQLRKLDILKRDIESAVKDIVNNITPANTQLFGVYFNDN